MGDTVFSSVITFPSRLLCSYSELVISGTVIKLFSYSPLRTLTPYCKKRKARIVHVHTERHLYLIVSIRILPHKQNTGGFFVAVLHKKHLLRDVQSSSKSRGNVHQLTSTSVVTDQPASVVTDQPTLDENNSTVLDTGSGFELESRDSATASDCTSSKQPVSSSSVQPGWDTVNSTLK